VANLHDPSLFNEDLAPIPMARRTWGLYNYASLWVAMSVCIPTYMLASDDGQFLGKIGRGQYLKRAARGGAWT
jgi:cytosine/uracil/thiamine/allantoin permease